jgi:hypothetical protein
VAKKSRQEIDDERALGWVDPDEDPDVRKAPPDVPQTFGKLEKLETESKADELGVSPSVSDGIKRLLVKYDISPLKLMIETMADKDASKSAKMAAAQAAFPYIHGKPAPAAPKQSAVATGVMEVPIAQSMEQWMGIAGPSQAQLKETVRQ